MMGSRDSELCRLALLSDEDCWLLLCRMALSGRNEVEFEHIGKKIAKKCNGLPLAAKALGSLFRFKSGLDEWEKVLNSEIWNMEEAEVDIFPHLLLSYNELSSTLKRCFSYCAVFPKDTVIEVENLIQNWMALGYLGSNIDHMELKGKECFDVLAMRSLIQKPEIDGLGMYTECKMHNIIHDFAQFVRKRSRVEGARMNKTTWQACDPLFVSIVNRFCSLDWNYKDSPLPLCDCLTRLRVLSMKALKRSIPQRMEILIHLRQLDLSENKLSQENLKVIFQLFFLQTLILYRCNLEEIPKEIGNLINLRHLDLSWNEALKELPREIGNLIHLRHLNLIFNKSLKELRESICCLRNCETCVHKSEQNQLSSLPPLGKLPCLEKIEIYQLNGLEFVGREFLGIGDIESSSNTSLIAFPKLKTLLFDGCPEGITDEKEQHCVIMPCLEKLIIFDCPRLTKLPRSLLITNARPLEKLQISGSEELRQYCRDNNVAFDYDCPVFMSFEED